MEQEILWNCSRGAGRSACITWNLELHSPDLLSYFPEQTVIEADMLADVEIVYQSSDQFCG
jgi:hypothetical protein